MLKQTNMFTNQNNHLERSVKASYLVAKLGDDENRCFNQIWTKKYFFVYKHEKAVCLICHTPISSIKDCNLKRHFKNKHKDYDNLQDEKREDKITQLKSGLSKQMNMFTNKNNDLERSVKASYLVAKVIAERKKPFTDGEFVKECLMEVVETLCPEKKNSFSNVCLSSRTITRRIEDMSKDLKLSQTIKIKNLEYISLCLDESTDTTDTAQLSVFIRGVTSNFDIFEEFLGLFPMKNTTTGNDILEAVLQCTRSAKVDIRKLVSVTTDGAPAMTGKVKGFTTLLKNHVVTLGHNGDFVKLHCVIHQEALCAKAANLQSVMNITVKVVNIILSNKLYHRQFRQILAEAEKQYDDLSFYCSVRWLSRGSMLAPVYELRNKVG